MYSPSETNNLLLTTDIEDNNVNVVEANETQGDVVTPSPPTPPRPRMMENGTVPPKPVDVPVMITNEEDDIDTVHLYLSGLGPGPSIMPTML